MLNAERGRTCSMVRGTKQVVLPYLLLLKADHLRVVSVTSDLDSLLDQYGLSS